MVVNVCDGIVDFAQCVCDVCVVLSVFADSSAVVVLVMHLHKQEDTFTVCTSH